MSEPELENDNNEVRDRSRSRSRSPQARRLWVQDLFLIRNETGNRLLTDITTSGIYETMNRFLSMKKEYFLHLLSLVGPKIAKMDTDFRKAITEQERLLITVRYLATGETFTSLQYVFRVSRHVSKKVKETCACLSEASSCQLLRIQASTIRSTTKNNTCPLALTMKRHFYLEFLMYKILELLQWFCNLMQFHRMLLILRMLECHKLL
ncbi:uncharacterized protein LOC120897720 [Anopheles arabiensis]|uniref:uncharacterized protein LOC120897720 n=1 Tax=Anopheles arabiensis TaxID=7173 RepID=UPI001AAD5F7D|nr:uncharacterized protein LOC120897720 [Anopheles arabiensis]